MNKHKQQADKWNNFISGLIAGFVSVTLCNPLDIIRTRLNIMSSPNHQSGKYSGFINTTKLIWAEEGWKGFYVGYRTTVIGVPIFNSLFFPLYEQSKKYLQNKGYSKAFQYSLSSLYAGIICNIITNPIWVVRTRIMVQILHPKNNHYIQTNPTQIMKRILTEEGPKALFKGLSASCLSITNPIIYFLIYQNLKSQIKEKHKKFNSFYVFCASSFSKLISSTLTYPLIVVRTILHDHRTEQKLKVKNIIKHIYKQNGMKGFFLGLKPDLIRIIPSNAIIFIIYQWMRRS